MKSIVSFFAKEHLLGSLLTILIIFFGIYSLTSMRRDIWPNVDFNVTSVTTVLPGASPEQVEKLIVNPVEEALREVEGVKKIFSTAAENTGVIVLQLDPDSRDPDKTNQDIQQAVDRIEDLPITAEDPIVKVIETESFPVIEVTVASDTATQMEIRNTAKRVGDRLSLLPKVSSIQKQGFRKREFSIEIDPEKLSQRRLSLNQVISAVSQRNVSIPGGTVETPGGVENIVRTEAQYSTPQDVGETVISSNESGFGTKLNEVAIVKEILEEPDRLYGAMGKPSINIIVTKKPNADTFELIKSVKDLTNLMHSELTNGVALGFSNDFSVYLSKRLNALSSNLLIGLFLVLIVLTLFLPWQVALVVAVGIPVALFSTFLTAYLFGISLNLISLIGLIIVLGMLVDDAIVVSENVWRHFESGKDLFSSVVQGTSEVFGPVLASILTTVSAFGPMLFMTGIFGSFVFEIPLMVILALAFSLFEAFIIMPSHFTGWIRSHPEAHQKIMKKSDLHWFTGIANKYQKFVGFSLRYRYGFASIVLFLLIATGVLLGVTGRFVLFPKDGTELFFIQVETPVGTSLSKTMKLMKPIEDQVALLPDSELKEFVSSAGIIQQDQTDPQTRRGSQYGQVRISLTPQNRRVRNASEIIEELRSKIGVVDGIEKVTFEEARQGPPQGRPISINILGPSFDKLKSLGDEVRQALAQVEGVKDIRSSFLPGKTEWQVIPKHEETAIAGLTATDVSTSVRAAFEGIVATSVRELDEEVDIRVRLKKGTGEIPDQLNSLKIGNRIGNLISLPQIAEFRQSKARSSISHLEFERLHNISAEVDLEVITPGQVIDQVKEKLNELRTQNPQFKITLGGEDEDTQESFQALGRAFIFATFIIFSLLIITFKNLLQPILVLTSIPLGFMGVAYAMVLHNRPFGFMSMLGVIALAGVIVNNAIVFTDFVNRERKRGTDLDNSILRAAKTRLRPIVLTTITTVCGLLPTAYGEELYRLFGIGGGDPFIVPIALSLGWGMAFGSLLTALFFPGFVRIIDDIIILFGGHKTQKKA